MLAYSHFTPQAYKFELYSLFILKKPVSKTSGLYFKAHPAHTFVGKLLVRAEKTQKICTLKLWILIDKRLE